MHHTRFLRFGSTHALPAALQSDSCRFRSPLDLNGLSALRRFLMLPARSAPIRATPGLRAAIALLATTLLASMLPLNRAVAQEATQTGVPAAAQAGVPTAAQAGASATTDDSESRKLYLEAIRAIAEGRKNDASAGLSKLVDKEPLHAGAWLDLALIQCELGHAREAEQLFAVIEKTFNPPPGILEVIAQQRQTGCNRSKLQRNWNLNLARGHDQNVNQGASNPNFTIGQGSEQTEVQLSPDFLPRADHYTLLTGEYLQEISHNGATGFAQIAARQNDHLNRFNNVSLALGLEQAWRLGQWSGKANAMMSFLSLGGKLYQRQSLLQVRTTPPLKLPERWQWTLGAGASHIQYLTLTNFNATTMDLRSGLGYQGTANRIQAHASWHLDHANSQRPGGNRRGWLTSLSWQRQLSSQLHGELYLSRQTWRGQLDYLSGIIDKRRNQETHVLRTSLQWPVAQHQLLQLEWRQVWNHENISLFQYRDRQLQLSWQWHY